MESLTLRSDLNSLKRTLESITTELELNFENALDAMSAALAAGNKIIAFGNGGSAADAEHLACEIVGRFAYDRPSLPAIALSQPSTTLTAIANDYGYENVFARQIQGLGKPGDVAFGISTSGNSPNVILGLQAAAKQKMTTIALVGGSQCKASEIADIVINAPARETPRVQEVHALLIHSLCRGIEERLFPKESYRLPTTKIIPKDSIKQFAKAVANRQTVFTNGCFDVIHPGHVALLREARSLGEMLIVGLNSDSSVKKIKGKNRPYHKFEDRAAVLSAFSCVDFIIEFSETTPLKLIRTLTPKVLVKGGDYTPETVVGADWVEKNGGRVVIFPLVGNHSTTRILEYASS